ncbi:MAG TPA: choice-of-anchor tandem repeat GloVer-containing protein [Candidatus Dormibacteraeota bacterium]|jgi:uncharacterized repeat protein (TIGR03803 family)|nr:choice-of-anchor tandem repeat GloVer-containing protein [Candidatus Dormibacteraeota bacterium]
MRNQKHFVAMSAAFLLSALILCVAPIQAFAQKEEVLHSFSITDKAGFSPLAPLIADSAGNFYGTTEFGGIYSGGTDNGGVVFELSPISGGHWTLKVLHNFGNGSDGNIPQGSLIFDASGNLYGATIEGGAYNAGIAFELSPQTMGPWRETILHNFNFNGTDGYSPVGGLTLDAAGNLYGNTSGGGAHNNGAVFKLSSGSGETWDETLLHSFGSGEDGSTPEIGGLIIDGAGNLFGTTGFGGSYNNGSVFEISPASGGTWTEKVIFSFNADSREGYFPGSGLIFDSTGNLYGAAQMGGGYGGGVVYELSSGSDGVWSYKVLYNFRQNSTDGRNPTASLIFDSAGNLYGTTSAGGAYGYGTAFELSLKAGGGWKENVLHSFNNNGADGYDPVVPLTLDPAGNLYSTTQPGGANAGGTIFRIKP